MSKHLEKVVSNQQFRDKTAFTTGLGTAIAKAVEQKPFTSLATGVTIGGLLGGAMGGATKSVANLTGQPIKTKSYQIDKALNPGFSGALTRIQADELLAQSLTRNAGEIANKFINESIGKMVKNYKKISNKPKQQALLKDLMENDEMLREADPEHIASLFNVMTDVAPKMTKYKDAVKSFLRQGIAHEGGLDPVTLGELAKAEARLNGKGYGND